MELSDGSHSAMLRVFVGLDIPTESESRNQILLHVCIFNFVKTAILYYLISIVNLTDLLGCSIFWNDHLLEL